MVGSLGGWQKGRQFRILNDKEERGVKVVRFSVECVIDVKELLVGDIALLEPGDIIPCNGIFVSGHNVKCDESGATGESDAIKKVAYGEDVVVHLRDGPLRRIADGSSMYECLQYPFLFIHREDGYHYDLQMSPSKETCLSQTYYIAYEIWRRWQDEFSLLADVIDAYIVECLQLLLDSSSRIKLPPFIQVSGFRDSLPVTGYG